VHTLRILPSRSRLKDLAIWGWEKSNCARLSVGWLRLGFGGEHTLLPFKDSDCDWPLSGDLAMRDRTWVLGILPYNEDNGIAFVPSISFGDNGLFGIFVNWIRYLSKCG
jgi:hypothetical protein